MKWDSAFHKEVVWRVNAEVFVHAKQHVSGGEDFTQDMEAVMMWVLVLNLDDELDVDVLSDEDHGSQPQAARPSIAGVNSDGVQAQVVMETLDNQSLLSDTWQKVSII